jgi:hypothetical protein
VALSLVQRAFSLSPLGVMQLWFPQYVADGCEKFLAVERFLEQAVVTRSDLRQSIQHFQVTGDQDHWQLWPCCTNYSQEFNAIHHGHVNVGDQAINIRETSAFEKFCGGSKPVYQIVSRFQQAPERRQNSLIVVYYCDSEHDSVLDFLG